MTRSTWRAMLAAGFLAGFAGQSAAETPLQFMQRFLKEPVDILNKQLRPVRKPAPKTATKTAATVPLLAVPMPHLRPLTADAAPVLGYVEPPVVAVPTLDMPEPRLRSGTGVETAITELTVPPPEAAAPTTEPQTQVAALPPEPLPKLVLPPPAAQSTCGLAIAGLGVVSTPLAAIEEGECGIAAPVAIASLDGGAVDFSSKAVVECDLAERLANWVRKEVEPAARRAYDADLTGLRIADSYSCRTRDNIPDAALSEHARGNAIDISAFRIGKRWIEVGPAWQGGGEDREFLAGLWKSACGPFTTVLGPDSDSFHAEHFHLDIIRRGKNGRNLYCH